MDGCQWFLNCNNDATTTRPHPLGDVPICDRCGVKLDAIDAMGRPHDDNRTEQRTAE